jgi:hypothetical protein
MSEGSFTRAIESHLALQRRNSRLEPSMPIERYREVFDDGTEPAPADDVPDVVARQEPIEGAYPAPWDDPDSWWNVA